MKYAIYDFSQAELVKFNDSHPNEKLDVIDLMIFRWFTHFAAIPKTSDGRTAMWRKVFDGEIYYWVNYQALIEEFPLFDINTKKSISRRFDKYVSGGLMKKKVYKARNKGSLTFFAFTTEFSQFEYDETNENQKINPHKTNTIQNEEYVPEESDFREDAKVLSKSLEETQMSSLKKSIELREDAEVLSKSLEKTQMSSPLNNTITRNSNSTANFSEKARQKESAAAGEFITLELKNLFGGHYVFDETFVPEILSLSKQFELSEKDICRYLKFVFERASEKKPNSLTNMYYKMAKSAAIMQDFVLILKKTKTEDEEVMAVCPICGSKAKKYESCPNCKFDMTKRTDEKEISLQKQIFALSDNEREQFLTEYNAEIERQGSFGFGIAYKNPKLYRDFREKIAEIYRKYGITA